MEVGVDSFGVVESRNAIVDVFIIIDFLSIFIFDYFMVKSIVGLILGVENEIKRIEIELLIDSLIRLIEVRILLVSSFG